MCMLSLAGAGAGENTAEQLHDEESWKGKAKEQED